MKVFTIGVAKKDAEKFFQLLNDNKVRKVFDIRLNNKSQLAGFTKENDLRYFLKILGNINYEHYTPLAPTKELMNDFKANKISWEEYKNIYIRLLEERNALKELDLESLDHACFLCSEDSPNHCHRRLVVEEIKKIVACEIIHLK